MRQQTYVNNKHDTSRIQITINALKVAECFNYELTFVLNGQLPYRIWPNPEMRARGIMGNEVF